MQTNPTWRWCHPACPQFRPLLGHLVLATVRHLAPAVIPLSSSPVPHPSTKRVWKGAKFTNATFRIVTRSTPRAPIWRPIKGHTRVKNHTNVHGKVAHGNSPDPMNWRGITVNTPDPNLSSAICAKGNFREAITYRCTWSATEEPFKSYSCWNRNLLLNDDFMLL